jgi:GrpB-like predicted nucleotidyltransferase (UPF0157 family)
MDARNAPPLGDAIHLSPHDPDWTRQFDLEKTRILEALGRTGRGGVAWAVHHIGSTAIPGIHAKPVIDILLEVYPAPLEAEHLEALGKLGYEYRGEAGIPGRQFFRTNPRTRHLHAYPLDSSEVHEHLLFRDYLRTHPSEAKRYEALKLELVEKFSTDREAYTNSKDTLVRELLENAERWWLEEFAFQPLLEVAHVFDNADFEWFASSGWALEAWQGKVHRYHHDVDILVWRDEQMKLKAFLEARGWTPYAVRDGTYEPWLEPLALPLHQIHAYKGETMLDILLAERDATNWQFRRDLEITRDLNHATLETRIGVRVLAPEIVLLFKSSSAGGNPRGKDQQDFERILPKLSLESRGWLRSALTKTKPDHPWLEVL